jgi:hypothetical protein
MLIRYEWVFRDAIQGAIPIVVPNSFVLNVGGYVILMGTVGHQGTGVKNIGKELNLKNGRIICIHMGQRDIIIQSSRFIKFTV